MTTPTPRGCSAVLLKGEGHETRIAFDGPAAIEAATLHRPDVVLLDLTLPGMSGVEVATELRCITELCRVQARRGLRLRRGTPAVSVPVRSPLPEARESRRPARISLSMQRQVNAAALPGDRRRLSRRTLHAVNPGRSVTRTLRGVKDARGPGPGWLHPPRWTLRSDRPRYSRAVAAPRSGATASMLLYHCRPRAVNGYIQPKSEGSVQIRPELSRARTAPCGRKRPRRPAPPRGSRA